MQHPASTAAATRLLHLLMRSWLLLRCDLLTCHQLTMALQAWAAYEPATSPVYNGLVSCVVNMQLKTTEMAAADLDKYHKALERALLAFHTGMEYSSWCSFSCWRSTQV
jgi:hypothetical protein